MAIAIASGAPPERGLYTAIFGGFAISLLGGSRFQIGGPAGAFIVVVSATMARFGYEGVALAAMMSGVILMLAGFLRLGTYVKFIPYPVTVGFTAGIAVIIFASQVKDLLGLAGTEPSAMLPKLAMLAHALPTLSPAAAGIALLTAATVIVLRKLRPHWPGFLIAVMLASIVAWALGIQVETIGTRFGGIARGLPMPHMPEITLAKLAALLPDAITFALLGSIESLLSATVADGMTGRRHRSNCELVAQGAANILSPLMGGICVTGAIARTATNIRAGARGPVAGILHSVFVLVFVLVAAPLASYIPLSALAALLAIVSWNMVEKEAFTTLLRASRGDALVLLATFLLAVFRGVTDAIVVGFALGVLLFLGRMAKSVGVEDALAQSDRADDAGGGRTPYDSRLASDPSRVIYRISGAFFFGAASTVAAVLDRIAGAPKTFILDFEAVPFLDSTAAVAIQGVARKAVGRGTRLFITGASPSVRHELWTHGIRPPEVEFLPDIEAAIEASDSPGPDRLVPAA
jgi:SulP family sulfate permease